MTAKIAWFTGLSGAGKTTIAASASEELKRFGHRVLVIDGDEVRKNQHKHLGFSPADIAENNRLIAERCRELQESCDYILVPIISPFRESRRKAREVLEPFFSEIYIRASLETVSRRDPKGLYRRAFSGNLDGLVGLSPEVPYEPPEAPDLILDTETESLEVCSKRLVRFLSNGI